jgi:hypothetical protein
MPERSLDSAGREFVDAMVVMDGIRNLKKLKQIRAFQLPGSVGLGGPKEHRSERSFRL